MTTDDAAPPGGKGPRLAGAAFAVALAAGLAAMVHAAARAVDPPPAGWLDGAAAARIEAALDRAFPIREAGIVAWTAIEYAVFGVGRPGVVVGPDGWLFSSEEATPPVAGAYDANLATIAAVRDALAARGTALVVAVVPDKLRVLDPALPAPGYPSYNAGRYARFRADLAALGIPAPDALPALRALDGGRGAFLRTDTHWTPAGARAMAASIAGAVPAGLFDEAARQSFETVAAGTVRHEGDLLRYLPLGPLQDVLGPAPDRLTVIETVAREPAAGGLFGPVAVPAALVGTSFSANPLWDFEGALEASLGVDVVNAADPGLGPVEPMLRYFDDVGFADAPPRLVVWEFPERYVTTPQPAWPAAAGSVGASLP